MNKVSIIIPIYNTGEYLHKCIKSVLAQELTELELILVDDGSSDNSGEICDFYAQQDKRIKVIHKKNEGVSIARNTGIQEATGEYIGFVDSDDWIESNMYSEMYELAVNRNADIAMCDAVIKYDDKSDEPDTIIQLADSCFLKKEAVSAKLLLELAGSACRCIYRRELLKVNDVRFPHKIPLSEDRIFNIMSFGCAEVIYYTKKPYYNRYVRKGSAVSRYYENVIEIIKLVRTATHNALDRFWSNSETYKKSYDQQIVGMAQGALNNAFYKTSPLKIKEKLSEVKKVCNCTEIREAIKNSGTNDLRSKLIMKKRILLLGIIAILLNRKYGR